ncbi:MAG: hypothetical protein HY924_00080 [Elusimicrobia bacterium]|nr:hypothetical protein [Elusimicrobiota bacterium]
MRILLVTLLAGLALGCKKAEVQAVQKAAADAKSGDTAVTKYVQGLQQDVVKAQDAVKKTNAATAESVQAADAVLQEADKGAEPSGQ